ncbi:MAG: hypothetical protein MOB07_10920 [Acidobacteria bacterium]|nr:hypothetical protein [Acidobacteriota bacterium]
MKKSFAVIVPLFICSALLVSVKGQSGSQAPNEPLTLQALNTMLRREVGRNMTEADLAARVELFGIAFDPTPDAISQLRKNGARQNLINTIKRTADNLSASVGKAVATGPQPADPFIEETRKVVRDYLDELPNFICQLIIQRYVDRGGAGAWVESDTLFYELTYNGKEESYKPISRPIEYGKRSFGSVFASAMDEIVGSAGRPIDDVKGAYSKGEFALTLAGIFSAESKAVFKPAGKERLGARQTILYDFRAPKESSKMEVGIKGVDTVISGYSGTVWIDAETNKVLRISLATDDMPKSHPVAYGERSVDYDMVRLHGLDADFLLPARAEVTVANRSQKRYSRNVMRFKLYRKFETDIKIGGDVTTPQKPPQ